jgi:2-methylcitrate dehydratase PrpD
MAYCVAVALLEGRAGLDQFAGDRCGANGVQPPGLASLVERTRVQVAGDLTAKYPAAWPARVTITLRDGSRLSDTSDYPRGNPENPINRRDLEAKFVGLVGPRLGSTVASRAVDAVRNVAADRDLRNLIAATSSE